ncbi:MAG TPA: diacylglycerol kinase family protein [Candidatus Dormibacteraeota bacterium]|nr:diacylglycerol kinase family protein [Candidatus Dormibacteraeota bacterium]
MTTVAVVNPASGAGRTGRSWPEMRRVLSAAGVEVEERLTTAPREATELTRAALLEGCERVVAVGGDGTLNEVVNGFLAADGSALAPGAVLGLLPSGTGGDFRRSAGIPTAAAAAAAVLAAGATRLVDAGRITLDGAEPRHFINIADAGLGGEVVARVNRGSKRAGGTATFLWHSLASLLSYRPRAARVEIDGAAEEGRYQNVVVANGRYFGGGMCVAPGADLADGLFDVVLFGDLPRMRSLTGIRRIYAGTHIGQPGIRLLRGRRVRVVPLEQPALCFEMEGEEVGPAPATVEILPAAIRLCAPG